MIFRSSERNFRFAFSIFVTLVVVVSASPIRAEVPLAEKLFPQVDVLLRNALEQSPTMITRNLERMQADELASINSSRLYPAVGANFNYDLRNEDRADLDAGFVISDRFLYNLSVSQSLYSWGAVRYTVEIGRIQKDLAAKNVLGAYRQLALDIRGSYMNLVLGRIALRNSRFDLELARKALAIIQARVDAHEMVGNMLIAPRRIVDEKTLALRRAERGFEISVRQFRRLTGNTAFDVAQLPETVPTFALIETPEVEPFHLSFVERGGLKDDVRFAVTAGDLEKEKLNLHVVQTNQRPKLDVVLGLSQEEQSYTANTAAKVRVTAASIGVRVNWNIFDGYTTRSQERASRARIRALERSLADTETGLRESAEQAAADIGYVREELRLAEDNFAGARGSLQLVKETQQAGRATEDDVRTAQLANDNAEYGALAARVRYLNAVAAYLYAVNADPAVNAVAGSILKH